MNGKMETIEVNILSDDDVVKEKYTYSTNRVEHGRQGTITEARLSTNGQIPEKDPSISSSKVEDHEKWSIYKQVKNLCFPGRSKKAERKERIQKILVSINSIEADMNQLQDDKRCKYCNKDSIEVVLLGIAILAVIGIFMIPVTLYYTGPPIPEIDQNAAEFFRTCIPDCSNFSQINRVCEDYLLDSPPSFIPGYFADNHEEAEYKLSQISNITSRCSNPANALAFFCKAGYLTCSNNITLLPNISECLHLQNDACREHWGDLQSISPSITCCDAYNPFSTCPDQFARFCGVCAPVCHEFSQHGEATTVAIDAIIAIAMIIGNLIFGIIVFAAAIVKRKTMFHFPNVLVLYFTAVYSIYGVFVVIPIFWRRDLLCSNGNLFIAVAESTTFCQIQGFALDAAILMYTEFWLLFIFHLFMKVVDPLRSWAINKRENATKIHIIEVVAVILLALVTPIVTVTATDGYRIGDFPPDQCYSDAPVFFHGVLLPNITMCIVGISLILITFFHIHRTTGIFKRTALKKRILALSVPELKLLIISFYLTIVLGVSTIQFTLNVRNFNDLVDGIMDYSQCVASGNCNCDDKREMIEVASLPETIFLFFICIMFLNCSNLLFIIQLKDVKHMARRATRTFTSTIVVD